MDDLETETNGNTQPKDWWQLSYLLRTSRERKGMSRAALARLSGISANTLVKYETPLEEGGKTPSISRMTIISRILDIDPRKIFDAAHREIQRNGSLEIPFSFVNHFATDVDYLKWRHTPETLDDLNSIIEEFLYHELSVSDRLARIEELLQKKDGPDINNPSRPSDPSNTEAVGAASSTNAHSDSSAEGGG